ncbi:MAG: hypothetical protein B7X58_15240, partial [Marinobacter sp. 34-60-7]
MRWLTRWVKALPTTSPPASPSGRSGWTRPARSRAPAGPTAATCARSRSTPTPARSCSRRASASPRGSPSSSRRRTSRRCAPPTRTSSASTTPLSCS